MFYSQFLAPLIFLTYFDVMCKEYHRNTFNPFYNREKWCKKTLRVNQVQIKFELDYCFTFVSNLVQLLCLVRNRNRCLACCLCPESDPLCNHSLPRFLSKDSFSSLPKIYVIRRFGVHLDARGIVNLLKTEFKFSYSI